MHDALFMGFSMSECIMPYVWYEGIVFKYLICTSFDTDKQWDWLLTPIYVDLFLTRNISSRFREMYADNKLVCIEIAR